MCYYFQLAASVVLVYMHHPTDRIEYATAFVTPVVEHWLEREIAQWVPTMSGVVDCDGNEDGMRLGIGWINEPP